MMSAASVSTTSAVETRALCSVRVGGQMYGVDINEVSEIIGPSQQRSVPCAPHFIGGLVPYRGEVLTTVNLRALFDLPPFEQLSSALVVEGESGTYGLLVDAVCEVVQVSAETFEAIPSTLDAKRKALLRGAYKLPKGLLIQLELKRLDPMALMAMSSSVAV